MKTIKNCLKRSIFTGLAAMAMFTFVFAGQIHENNKSSELSNTTSATNGDTAYGFCTHQIGGTRRLEVVVSSVFQIDPDISATGVENSFFDYTKANFDVEPGPSPSCYTTIKTYQKAVDMRNEAIAGYRYRDWTVRSVTWSYDGD